MVRQDAQQLGRRERRVQEEADRLAPAKRTQPLSERDQVIVVHPHQIARVQHRPQRAREGLVDPQIARQVAPGEADQRRPVMEQRPQHPVGVADVVFVPVAPRQVERRPGDVAGGDAGRRCARLLGERAAEAKPDAPSRLQRGAQRHRQPALAGLAGVHRPDAVRHDHQTASGGGRRRDVRGGRRRGGLQPEAGGQPGIAAAQVLRVLLSDQMSDLVPATSG